ncbi:uracil-DNA glycosylase family protein [Parasphingorhabdus flavimaris]|uniref:Uracil-DNA glycosylase family protein n=1 Tax=Parasphingorhabdus flavimaris TaxID=266812 RepID=A0ABX2N3K4_9SPHN|nr:uracil-DNA glycosylase family protein [Parasphingorhabdus flavimaris]NVD28291.1 uracil-DNA glycosylase family protein [Parasphingorhabdus flavimaris]
MLRNNGQLEALLKEVRACTICTGLPLGPKPLLQADSAAQILLVGQAPGSKTHEKGRPFDDVSGKRLRGWLGVTEEQFYDPRLFAIIPMGFCFPGTGQGGDMPPRPECAPAWRQPLLDALPNIRLTLVLGQYAMNWHLGDRKSRTLTDTVKRWREFWPELLPLPHPSPRNIRWFKANPWFETDVIPFLQDRVRELT